MPWLGLLVLAGVLSLMLLAGWLLFVLQASFAAVLPWLLPLIYAAVIVLGIAMLLGRNPFRRLSMAQTPALRNPLPGRLRLRPAAGADDAALRRADCGQRLSAGGRQRRAVGEQPALLPGFWPGLWLAARPAAPAGQPFQRQFTQWTVRYDRVLTAVSGALLVAIGVLGFVVEVGPNL